MKKPAFVQNGIYHVYNRGVEKRNIFLDTADRYRFVQSLIEFNSDMPADNLYYHFSRKEQKIEPRRLRGERELGKPLVNIFAFCLMLNHFHLMVQQVSENGVVAFMQKLGTGYTKYFNTKHERVGHLFQGRFKATHVATHAHLLHLPLYIHCNPLDSEFPEWRDYQNLASLDWEKAMEFLEKYRWSSYLDYMGKENFPEVIHKEFLTELFGDAAHYKKEMGKWLKGGRNAMSLLEEFT